MLFLLSEILSLKEHPTEAIPQGLIIIIIFVVITVIVTISMIIFIIIVIIIAKFYILIKYI